MTLFLCLLYNIFLLENGDICMTQIAFTGDVAFTKYFSESCSDVNLISKQLVNKLSISFLHQITQLLMLKVQLLQIQ